MVSAHWIVWTVSLILVLLIDDFRIFVGDLGNDVNDDTLARSFSKYQSFLKAKVIRDKFTKKTKGFGFVSFKNPQDFMQAMKEMNGMVIVIRGDIDIHMLFEQLPCTHGYVISGVGLSLQ